MDFGKDLSNFFTSLTDWIGYALHFLVGMIAGIFDAFFYYLKAGFYTITNLVFDLLQSMLAGSPLAAKIAYLQTAFSGGLGYYADYFQLPEALMALFSAYLVRFFIRRLPVIG